MMTIGDQKIHEDIFFNESLSLLGVANFEGKFVRMNKIFLDTLGYTWDEIKNIPFLKMVHPEDVPKTIKEFEKGKQGKRTISFTNRYFHKYGHIIYFEWSAVPDVREGLIYCTAKDITEQKLLEEKLSESEASLRLLLEAAPMGVTLSDASRKLKYVNQTFCEMLGYSTEELMGRDWKELTYPEDLMKNLEKFRKISAGELPKLTIHKRYYRRDGSIFWAKVVVVRKFHPVVGQDLFVTSVMDISKEIKLTEELNDLNKNLELRVRERTQELQRSNKDLEQFVYIASHDLKEPLRTIENYLGLVKKEKWELLDQEAQFFLDRMKLSNRRMLNLVNDLLEYSRVGRKKEFEPIDLNELLQGVLLDMESAVKRSGAKVEIAPLPVVMGVKHDLWHLFANLLSNAIKFCKKDRAPEISITLKQQEGKYCFAIQDNGIGMEEIYLERIFSVFKRLHNSREYEGTGIGLSLCKKIVELYGGKIWAHSDFGKGTTFYFDLPLSDC